MDAVPQSLDQWRLAWRVRQRRERDGDRRWSGGSRQARLLYRASATNGTEATGIAWAPRGSIQAGRSPSDSSGEFVVQ